MKKYFNLPDLNPEFILDQECFMLFETSKFSSEEYMSFIFFKPVEMIRINNFNNMAMAFRKIEKYSKEYFHILIPKLCYWQILMLCF